MRKALTLEPKDIHSLTNSRILMVFPQVLNISKILLGEIYSNHVLHIEIARNNNQTRYGEVKRLEINLEYTSKSHFLPVGSICPNRESNRESAAISRATMPAIARVAARGMPNGSTEGVEP
jgi:hypothetical protein